MRANEFITLEQKLDEVVPLITGNNSIAQARRGVSQAPRPTGSVSTNKTIGTQGTPQSTAKNQMPDQGQVTKAEIEIDRAIAPGKTIPLPSAGTGKPTNFKITKVSGDEVEIENPDGQKDPSQPNKLTYNRNDIKKSIAI
jgi:hypothetical protein